MATYGLRCIIIFAYKLKSHGIQKGHYSPFFFLHNVKECEKFHNMKNEKVITFNILASGQQACRIIYYIIF